MTKNNLHSPPDSQTYSVWPKVNITLTLFEQTEERENTKRERKSQLFKCVLAQADLWSQHEVHETALHPPHPPTHRILLVWSTSKMSRRQVCVCARVCVCVCVFNFDQIYINSTQQINKLLGQIILNQAVYKEVLLNLFLSTLQLHCLEGL